MPVLKKRQFMADITICNSRVITGEITIFGNGLPSRGKTESDCHAGRIRKSNPRETACLCRNRWNVPQWEKTFILKTKDDGTKIHEAFHAEVAALKILSVVKWTTPVEESAAYAYTDFRMLLKWAWGAEDGIKMHCLHAKYSVRFLVGTDNLELSRMRTAAVGVLRRTGTMLPGDSAALAFSYAENFLCYMECLAVLRRWGLKDGKKILFDAIREGGWLNPENARRFLLAELPAIVQEDVNESYGIDPAKLRIRALHHHDYKEEELVLQ